MNIEQDKAVNNRQLIDELLRDPVLTIVQLKQGAAIQSGTQLYQQCQKQVRQIQGHLTRAKYSQSVIDDISYAVCALLDETVLLCSRDSGQAQDYDEWLGAPLQVIFFNTHNAGNDLYDKIRSAIRADKPNQLILNCYDRVLGLGFQGIYLGQAQTERDQLVQVLHQAISVEVSDPTTPITVHSQGPRYWGHKTVLILSAMLSVVLVIAVYVFLNQDLQQLLQQLKLN